VTPFVAVGCGEVVGVEIGEVEGDVERDGLGLGVGVAVDVGVGEVRPIPFRRAA
jgi:hypothetical protein